LVATVSYRAIYGDTDQMGFMYYANYFRLFEMGRNEYMRESGLTYQEVERRGYRLPVTEARCRYRKSIRYDDLVRVETRVTRAKGARVHFRYEVKDERGEVLAEGETEHAAIDAEGRVVRLSAEMIAALSPEGH
jgi:acyl-CoA thioester hydrolase